MTPEKTETAATSWFLPWRWYAFLTVLALVGAVLLNLRLSVPTEMRHVLGHSLPRIWSHFLGAACLGVVAHHLVVFSAARIAGGLLKIDSDFTPTDRLAPALTGLCEAVLYPAALFLGKPEFIGVWLAIKVAGQWVRWSGTPTGAEASVATLNRGRRLFNRFLIGNAISVLAGLALWFALGVILALERGS